MTERKRRKKNRVRGERTHSKGDTKNNRGGGNRGGRGRAGATKGKFASLGRLDPKKYRLKPNAHGDAITLGNLDAMLDTLVAKNKVNMDGKKYVVTINSGYEKVLSQGTTTKAIVLKINASKKAIEKITAAGGEFDFPKKGMEEATTSTTEVEEETKEVKVEKE
ncbi:MAG: 50S ribosomal protein L15 [Candidatus Diapherotrites archaeon]|jgi:large subunit ribosomal protein L15|uniref:50S ribosomal protein L15 n=1 Tax=Candidatus Iainarchaeum sp. TaxID=3101447 RepID=A0A8T5GFC9_9ARCH|nr:50S ribosomal protein L15 [Candidatus Diapherotrites archaeon]MBT7241233.1 50S ribosomal protein L15 [Candidatus Diapherotrites archaeon]